jgi:cytochrome c553
MNKLLIACLIAYAPFAIASKLTQDSELVQTCGGCHGIDGNSTLPIAPSLAGQLPGYLSYELRSYKRHDRVDDFMGAIMDPISDEDVSRLVAYYKTQKLVVAPPAEPVDPALIARGKVLYNREVEGIGLSCADCHDDHGEGVENPSSIKDFPRLAGQQNDYLVSNLQQYAGRMKNHSLRGMRGVAAKLKDDDIKALAAYLSNIQ